MINVAYLGIKRWELVFLLQITSAIKYECGECRRALQRMRFLVKQPSAPPPSYLSTTNIVCLFFICIDLI